MAKKKKVNTNRVFHRTIREMTDFVCKSIERNEYDPVAQSVLRISGHNDLESLNVRAEMREENVLLLLPNIPSLFLQAIAGRTEREKYTPENGIEVHPLDNIIGEKLEHLPGRDPCDDYYHESNMCLSNALLPCEKFPRILRLLPEKLWCAYYRNNVTQYESLLNALNYPAEYVNECRQELLSACRAYLRIIQQDCDTDTEHEMSPSSPFAVPPAPFDAPNIIDLIYLGYNKKPSKKQEKLLRDFAQTERTFDFLKIIWGLLLARAESQILSNSNPAIHFSFHASTILQQFDRRPESGLPSFPAHSGQTERIKIESKSIILKTCATDDNGRNVDEMQVSSFQQHYVTGTALLNIMTGLSIQNDIEIDLEQIDMLKWQGLNDQEARDYAIIAATLCHTGLRELRRAAIDQFMKSNAILEKVKLPPPAIEPPKDELEKIAARCADLNRIADAAKAKYEEAQKELQASLKRQEHLQSEKARAETELSEMETQNKDLRIYLDELLKSVDEDETEPSEPQAAIPFPIDTTGLSIVMVGGHPQFHNQISKLIPGIVFNNSQAKRLCESQIRNADLVVFQVNHLGHSQYYAGMRICKGNGVNYMQLSTANAERSAQAIGLQLQRIRK